MALDRNGMEVTQERWQLVEDAVHRFIRRYPLQWADFKKELAVNRTEFQVAKEGDLAKSGFRNTLSFPVACRYLTPEERAENPEGSEVEVLESLKHTLDDIIPGFTDPDQNAGKADQNRQTVKNQLYREFIRRYSGWFQPGEKY